MSFFDCHQGITILLNTYILIVDVGVEIKKFKKFESEYLFGHMRVSNINGMHDSTSLTSSSV